MLKHFSYLLLLSLCACNFFTSAQPDQSQSDLHQTFVANITSARLTATAEADRLVVTQEGLQTAVRDVELLNTRTAVTLIALGTPFIDVSIITPAAPVTLPPAVRAESAPVVITPGGAAQGSGGETSAVSTPIASISAQAVVDPNAPYLNGIVTSEQVGSDNCAVAPTNSFASTSRGIYVIATAYNLSSQNVVTYRWQRDSIEVHVDTWSPSGLTNARCIWYYLTPAEAELAAGSWAVEILIDGAPTAAPITFTINP
jgi:hypothetical protein